MQYYAVPVGVLESATELTRWAKRAVAVAASGAESKGGTRRRFSSSKDD
jgi:TfoX/Sxy family transcriptional regulator of competence genes